LKSALNTVDSLFPPSPLSRASDASGLAAAVPDSGAGKARPSGNEREAEPETPLPAVISQSAAAPPPRVINDIVSPSSQRRNAPKTSPPSASQRQIKVVDGSQGTRSRHIKLESVIELEHAVAVDIPASNDNRHEFLFEWRSPHVAASVSPKSGAAEKLKAMLSARRSS
jgi:hypothetical protein